MILDATEASSWKLDILTDIVLNKMLKCIEYNALNKNVLNKIVEKNKVCVCFYVKYQLLEQQLPIELIYSKNIITRTNF